MNKIILFMVSAFLAVSCTGNHGRTMADNAESVCDTARFDSLSPDNWSGVMLRNSSRTAVKGLTLYVENASAFYVDIKSLRKSEPNRIYSTGDMEPLLDEALLCTPERRGFYDIDLGDMGISSRGDIFILFRAASSAKDEVQRIALCRYKPESRFCCVGLDGRVSYSDVEGLDIVPPFVSVSTE